MIINVVIVVLLHLLEVFNGTVPCKITDEINNRLEKNYFEHYIPSAFIGLIIIK